MLYIKIMADEDTSDTYAGKNYTLITIGDKDRIQFGEWGALYGHPENPWKRNDGNQDVLIVVREKSDLQETYCILGNVYIMNEQGKTISSRVKR